MLRLQKLHVIVGQDTDSESTPYGAGDAAGSSSSTRSRTSSAVGRSSTATRDAPARARWSGFTVDGVAVPTEGAVVLHGGAAAGQVTSARRSPKLGTSDRARVGADRAGGGRRPARDLRRGRAHRRDRHDAAVLRPRGRGAALVSALAFLQVGRRPGGAQPARRPRPRRPAPRSRCVDGWEVPVRLRRRRRGAARRRETVGFADRSSLAQARGARARSTAPGVGRGGSRRTAPGGRRCDARRGALVVARRALEASAHVVDVTAQFAALASPGPLARETFARFCALDLRDAVTPRGRVPAGLGRAHARHGAARGRRTAGWCCSARRTPSTSGRSWRTPAAGSAADPSARRRSMRDLFRKRRMWRPRPELKESLRRRDHRRRRARAGHRLLPAPARHHQRRGAREGLHRLGRGGPQHHDPALELQDARGRALLRRVREALRGPRRGARLQPAVQPVRAPHARALRPRAVRDGQPRRGQPAAGHRLAS